MAPRPSIIPCGWRGRGRALPCGPRGMLSPGDGMGWGGVCLSPWGLGWKGTPELGDATLVVIGGCKLCFGLNSWPRR